MTTKMIGIMVFDDVLTSEVIAPAEVFGMARKKEWFQEWQVLLIGVEQKATIKTAEGITLTVDATIYDDVTVDVLIVPGAYDLSHLFHNETLNQFIKKQEETAQWMGSNCSGAFLLANSGVLDGKKATTWFGGEAQLQAQFPQVEVLFDAPVVVDNRLVTSNGGLVSYQAAIVLLGQLSSAEQAREVFDALHSERLEEWHTIAQSILSAGATVH